MTSAPPAPSRRLPALVSPAGWKSARRTVSRLTRQANSSFFWPMMLLPQEKRTAMHALYAFCREADDAVDRADSPDSARARLAFWETQLAQAYAPGIIDTGELHPVMLALLPAIRRYQLPRACFDEILHGIRMDIDDHELRAPSRKLLSLYCYRVAGCVGLLAIRIFGCHSPQAKDYAIALGEALQLTNILRDVREDLANGRLYLPREYCARHHIPVQDLAAVAAHPALADACRQLADDAHDAYRRANLLYPASDRAALRPARLMQHIYAELLHYVERHGLGARDIPRPGRRHISWWVIKGLGRR